MFQRLVDLTSSRSIFLFGPRGTGKTTLLKRLFEGPQTLWIDLLAEKDETLFRTRPEELSSLLDARRYRNVVIDEIQKVPKLLDVVQGELLKKRSRFILTGSSARKLRRGAANLLGGRAATRNLHPLTHRELGDAFRLGEALSRGTLPELFDIGPEADKDDFLRSYVSTYLKEEILVEQLVRKTEPFRNFLPVAAQCNGEILNLNRIAFDLGVDHKTVETYFQILEDTLVGLRLPSYHRSVRKQMRLAPKFYLFDPGVVRAMAGKLRVPVLPETYEYGKAFEHWVLLEAMRLNDYRALDYRFSYVRTKDGAEIDLVIERPGEKDLLVEVKSKERVRPEQATPLRRFLETWPVPAEGRVWSRDKRERKFGDIRVLGWQAGLKEAGL